MTSAFELFSIGVGPSSSHTVGPMRAARAFAEELAAAELLVRTQRVRVDLFGSLGATGRGHGSDRAVLAGLEGDTPESVDTARLALRLDLLAQERTIKLLGQRAVTMTPSDVILHRDRTLPGHPNGMTFSAFDVDGGIIRESTWYSVGGGFILTAEELGRLASGAPVASSVPHPFSSADELVGVCERLGLSVSEVMLRNELSLRSEDDVRRGLLRVWEAMRQSIANGIQAEGILPGGLRVPRRAARMHGRLIAKEADQLDPADWLNLFALAVNEENAAGGRIVTAPTNGAAGIVPAVLAYRVRFVPGSDDDAIVRFLLCAAAIGSVIKQNASISGAEVGCQGEVGSACAMAAGALCEALGGTPAQVENAAEIGLEHHLGLTCDPVSGLVQIPCIERNAIAAGTAVNAARIAMHGDGSHVVSLDTAIRTMKATGRDMSHKYKETSLGGLAVSVIEC